MIRITGGEAKGRQIKVPEGLSVRPTASKMRQALFNILIGKVEGADFLDLCAGTGAMGIEALSRGASSLIAVDESARNVRAIENALRALKFDAEVIAGDVRDVVARLPAEHFDIIFADPPYKTKLPGAIVELVDRKRLLRPGGVLAVEHTRDYKFPENLSTLVFAKKREYGQSAFSFFTHEAQGDGE